MPYRRVVVGTDGSQTAAIAVQSAAQMAAAFNAELLIVTAFQPQPVERVDEDVPEDIAWRITDSAVAEDHAVEAAQIALKQGLASKQIHALSERGDPATALVRVAEERGGDVIVVGSRGMSSPSRFLLGSVPNKVSHHAPCDVMIVHTVD
ncbi:MAG TPA: universal stress protein [Acidimicrobiales bacterium]